MLSLFVLGSCRVHRPLREWAAHQKCHYTLNGYGGEPPYTHTPSEHLQFIQHLAGEKTLPDSMRPFAYYLDPAYQVQEGASQAIYDADAIVVEIASLREYFAGPYALNMSRTARMLITNGGLKKHPMMEAVKAQEPIDPAVVRDAIETAKMAGVAMGPMEEWVMHTLWSREIGPWEISGFLSELVDRFGKPVIAVVHAVPHRAPDEQIEQRKKLREVVGRSLVQRSYLYDPTRLLDTIPQELLYQKEGQDTAHYHKKRYRAVGADMCDFVTSVALAS